MIVLKFGGTSVGSVENIKKVAAIVSSTNEKKIVVLSAMSGVTNTLQNISNLLSDSNIVESKNEMNLLNIKYLDVIADLYDEEKSIESAKEMLILRNDILLNLLDEIYTDKTQKNS